MKTRSSAYVFFQTGNEFTRMGDTFSFDNGLQVFRHATLNSLLIKSLRGGVTFWALPWDPKGVPAQEHFLDEEIQYIYEKMYTLIYGSHRSMN